MHILISCRLGAKVLMFLKINKTHTVFERKKEENRYCKKVTAAQCWVNALSGCQQTREVQEVTDDAPQMPAHLTLLVLLKNHLFLHSEERKEPLFCRVTKQMHNSASATAHSVRFIGVKDSHCFWGQTCSEQQPLLSGRYLLAPVLPVVSQWMRDPAEEILKSWK